MSSATEMLPGNGGIPIRYFLTPDSLPDPETVAQLKILANTAGLSHHVSVLPDVHRKRRNSSPTGTVVVSKDVIVPGAVDTGINCGIRMITTEIDAAELTPRLLDHLFGELMRTIPVKEHDSDVLSDQEVAAILVDGGKWSQRKYSLSDEEMDRIENRAAMPTDTMDPEAILASVPRKARKKGRRRFCALGHGNHFLELQEIIELLDEETAHLLGLREGAVFFMLHTGSGSLGSKMMKSCLAEIEVRLGSQKFSTNGASISSVPANSVEGVRYARAMSAASNFGFANRVAITEMLRSAVRKVFDDQALDLPLLFDCGHVSIKLEEWNGKKLWVHRHGASRALPASHFTNHPLFSRTGQPVPVPGSMGHDSFVGVADENAREAFCSVNHGAGRIFDKHEALNQFTDSEVEAEMRNKNIRLYRYHSDKIAAQAPKSFKNISNVVDTMTALSLIRPVARTRPMAVLKG